MGGRRITFFQPSLSSSTHFTCTHSPSSFRTWRWSEKMRLWHIGHQDTNRPAWVLAPRKEKHGARWLRCWLGVSQLTKSNVASLDIGLASVDVGWASVRFSHETGTILGSAFSLVSGTHLPSSFFQAIRFGMGSRVGRRTQSVRPSGMNGSSCTYTHSNTLYLDSQISLPKSFFSVSCIWTSSPSLIFFTV